MTRLNNDEEQEAQRIACSHLVRGCEGAVSELRSATGEHERQSPTVQRAGDILAQVSSSWQDALTSLRPVEDRSAVAPVSGNLAGWTSDELFSETVERRAGDAPALRLMQGVLLQALLTAHDHEPASDNAVN